MTLDRWIYHMDLACEQSIGLASILRSMANSICPETRATGDDARLCIADIY